jgi:hypothetical protein
VKYLSGWRELSRGIHFGKRQWELGFRQVDPSLSGCRQM